jgi:hypothetical protein
MNRNVVSIITIITGVLFTPVFTVSAIEYGGIGGRPAFPQLENPRTQSIFVHTLEPGVVKSEGVRVINNTKDAKMITLYATDSTPSTDGAFACKQKSEISMGVGSWITLESSVVEIPSMSSQIVPFTITVPENADTGEQNGCILIQEIKEKTPGQSGATLSIRTGLRVAITIPGDIVKRLELTEFLVIKDDSQIVLSPQVTNTGNVSVDTELKVVTKNIFGKILQEHGGMYPVLRGQVSDWNFELQSSAWGGFHTTRASITHEQTTENGTVETITQYSDTEIVFIMPSTMGIVGRLIILLLILTLLYRIWYYKKKKKIIATTWQDYTIQEGDTIVGIAQNVAVPWKQLAQINSILPPYVLTPGQTIKIPPQKHTPVTAEQKSVSKKVAQKRIVRKKPVS